MSVFRARRPAPRPAGEAALASLLCLSAPLWILALSQAAGESLAVGGVAPSIILLAVAVVSWTRPGFGAVAFAALLGCCSDVSSALPFGLEAARFGLLAAALSSVRQSFATDVPGSAALVLAVFVVLERLAHVLVAAPFLAGLDVGAALGRACWTALYTALLLPFALVVARTLLGEIEDRRRR